MTDTNNVLIFPKLKRYAKENKTELSVEEIDSISTHYINEVFNGMRNQNLVSEKEIPSFVVLKEFFSAIVLNRHNVYHPFSEILEEILSMDNSVGSVDVEEGPNLTHTPKKRGRPKKKAAEPASEPASE